MSQCDRRRACQAHGVDDAPKTRYARNGETLAEFAIERRLIIGYDDIAPQLREAIMLTATIAGFPPAMNAMATLKSVLAERERDAAAAEGRAEGRAD